MPVGWATFEGRVVTATDGREQLQRSGFRNGAGVPYRRGSFFCLEIVNDGLLTAAPLPVYPGDVCIFEAGRQPRIGDIVAARLKRSRMIVRVVNQVSAREIELSTANKFRDCPSIRVKKSDIERIGVLKSIVQLTGEEKKYFGIM
ncbi:MAG: S24 family peptidase [Ignavibacteriales bacterium]|nr:S24 family peptidase [Ignavibacteriales bacterium]